MCLFAHLVRLWIQLEEAPKPWNVGSGNHPQTLSSFCVRLAMPSGTQLSEGCRRILVCRRSWTWTRLMKWMRYHWVGVIIWSCGCGVSPVAGLRTHVWGLLVTTQHLVAMVSKCCPAATNRCVYYSLHTFLIHSFIHFFGMIFFWWFPGSRLEQAKALWFLSLPWARSCSGLSLLSFEHPLASLKSAAIQ